MRMSGLRGEDDPGLNTSGNWLDRQLVKAPIPAYNGPVDTAVWGSAGDPLPIHEQKIYAAGFYHVVGDPVTWYSDLVRFNGESGEMETIRQRVTFDAESDPVVERFLNDPDLWDIAIGGQEFKRIGDGSGFVFDVIAPMKAAAQFNPAYGLIVPGNVYRAIIEQYSPKQHIGFGFVGQLFNQNIGWVVPATLAVMGGAIVAGEAGWLAVEGATAAEAGGAVVEATETGALLETAAEFETVAEALSITEEIAIDAVAEQLAVESLPEVIQQAATMPDYFPAVELPAPSSIPGAVNWGQLATKAVGFGSSLYQQQQAKQAAADQASARKRPLPGAALQMSGFPLILIAAAGAVTLMLLTTQGKRRHVSRSTR
jgi:hypothetical protein